MKSAVLALVAWAVAGCASNPRPESSASAAEYAAALSSTELKFRLGGDTLPPISGVIDSAKG